jgi:hypothetical protein
VLWPKRSRTSGNELRQAAVWGLGKAGLKAYDKVLPFIDDEDENLALHAIAAFGTDTPRNVISTLVYNLQSGNLRKAAAASEALRIIGSGDVLEALLSAANSRQSPHEWVLTTLSRLPATMIKQRLHGDPLLNHIKPLLLLSEEENWLSTEELTMDILFLLKQNI